MHVRRLAVLFVAALVLAACGSPPPAGPASVRGSVAPTEDFVFGVGLLFYAADIDMFELAPATVFEPTDGVYVTAIAPLDADGNFTLELPSHADVPADHLLPAAEFLLNVELTPACTLVPSDASAQVSFHVFELVSFPGIFTVTENGASLAIVSDEAIDTTLPTEEEAIGGRPIITWLYADKPVTIATAAEGCSDLSGALEVDLTLVRGWNQVAWTIDFDAMVLSLTNDATAAPVVTVFPNN